MIAQTNEAPPRSKLSVVAYIQSPADAENTSRLIQRFCLEWDLGLRATFYGDENGGTSFASHKILRSAIQLLTDDATIGGLIIDSGAACMKSVGFNISLRKKFEHMRKRLIILNDGVPVLDECESENLADLSWDLSHAKFGRVWRGFRPPFGWRPSKDPHSQLLLVDRDEQRVLRAMSRLHRWCGWTQKQIAAYLNRRARIDDRWLSKTNKRGKKLNESGTNHVDWSQGVVGQMLQQYRWVGVWIKDSVLEASRASTYSY